jgi:subtilisin family serine protease
LQTSATGAAGTEHCPPMRSLRLAFAAALLAGLVGVSVYFLVHGNDGTTPAAREHTGAVLEGLHTDDTVVDETNRDRLRDRGGPVQPTEGPSRDEGGLADEEPTATAAEPPPPVAGADDPKPAAPTQVIVRFAKDASSGDRADARDDAGVRTDERLPVTGMEVVQPEQGTSVGEAVKGLEANPDVLYAEPDVARSAFATPSDPLFAYQWALENTGQTVGGFTGTPGDDIAGTSAWQVSTGAAGVVVGIVDTGVDLAQPDLVPNLWRNTREVPGNGVDDDGNGYVDDVNGWDFNGNDNQPQDAQGHGTHVAGIIGARGNDGVGVAGVAWQSSLAPLQALGADGSGRASDVIRAYAYAGRMGIPIVNASLGGPGSSQAERDTIAAASGTLFIVAAGNDGTNDDTTPKYPCSYDLANVLCVAATDSNDALASFSNYGPGAVDLAAPGVSIASTYPGGRWVLMSGTSMATPYVSGAAALGLARNPGISPAQLKGLLMASVTPEAGLTGRVGTGGRLDAAKVLGAARIAPEGAPQPAQPAAATPVKKTDRKAPTITLTITRPANISAARKRGLTVKARCSESCSLSFEVRSGTKRLGSSPTASAAAAHTLSRRLKLSKSALTALRRGKMKVRVTATDRSGNARTKEAKARLR